MSDNKHIQMHQDIVKRLKRAYGHLNAIIEMLQKEHPCADLAQQLHAVEKAVGNAKKMLIHDHINHCLEQSTEMKPKDVLSMIEEFKVITKYL